MNDKIKAETERRFDELLSNHDFWVMYSTRLEEAVAVLESEDWSSEVCRTGNIDNGKKFHTPVILMLRGMGLECLLKGLLIKQGKITSTGGVLSMDSKYQKHDLVLMAEDVDGLVLSEKEAEILVRVGYYIVAGRLPRNKVNTGKFNGFWFADDDVSYRELVDKVKTLLR